MNHVTRHAPGASLVESLRAKYGDQVNAPYSFKDPIDLIVAKRAISRISSSAPLTSISDIQDVGDRINQIAGAGSRIKDGYVSLLKAIAAGDREIVDHIERHFTGGEIGSKFGPMTSEERWALIKKVDEILEDAIIRHYLETGNFGPVGVTVDLGFMIGYDAVREIENADRGRVGRLLRDAGTLHETAVQVVVGAPAATSKLTVIGGPYRKNSDGQTIFGPYTFHPGEMRPPMSDVVAWNNLVFVAGVDDVLATVRNMGRSALEKTGEARREAVQAAADMAKAFADGEIGRNPIIYHHITKEIAEWRRQIGENVLDGVMQEALAREALAREEPARSADDSLEP